MDNYKNFLLDLFFPVFCLGCKKEGVYLCDDCKATLDILEYQRCLCNKNPLILPPNQKRHGKCSRCSNKKLSGLYFALSYKERSLTKKLIRNFKYKPYIKDLAKTLAGILIEHLVVSGKNTEDLWENSILIPVPLDKKKLRSRGYNQSEELTKELATILKVPVIANSLVKIKTTKPQMELSKEEREQNLEGAFLIKKPFDFAQGKKIFLVDDVYTTGSTMEECAGVLRDEGAKIVWGIAIAREG